MQNNFSMPGFLWLFLTLICLAIILFGLYQALKKTDWSKAKRKKIFSGTTIIIILWISLLAILSNKGFFADFSKFPPRPGLGAILPLPFVLFIAFSKSGTFLLQSIPPQWLVFMQAFRIFVELLIWFAFIENMLPVQMTFEGKNFDILTGIFALPAGYLLLKNKSYARGLAVTFNILGIILLLNIVIIAVLSMPTSFRYFMNEPANSIVAYFPFILLPGVLVPIAYSFHIFSLRQLLTKNLASKKMINSFSRIPDDK